MIRIAVLGDIGSGKSYVAKQFGYPVFNADVEIAKLYKKNRKCYNKLKKIFPEYIVSFPAKKTELIKKDFKPFRRCQSLFAMTAHVIYTIYDPVHTATHSKIVINDVIRKHIGFKGLLISDDISMKALKYGLKDNAIKALNAGCNLILHCNGNIKEISELIKIIPTIDKFTQKKTSHFYKFLG